MATEPVTTTLPQPVTTTTVQQKQVEISENSEISDVKSETIEDKEDADWKYLELLKLLPTLTNTVTGQDERAEISVVAMKIIKNLTSSL